MFNTGAFSYYYTPAIFRKKLTTFLVFELLSLARNGCLYNVLSMSIYIYSVYKTSISRDVVCLKIDNITYGAKFVTKISLIFEFQRFHKES